MLKKISSMQVILLWSTIMGVCSSNWIMAWVCLEINTLAMCWIIAKDMKSSKTQESPTLMYYLIQVTASVLLLISAYQETSTSWSFVMTLSLMTKMGAWPMHSWYMKLISMLEMKQVSMMVIMTWQKIMPVILILSLNKSASMTMMLSVLAVTSMVTPLSNLLSTLSMKSIMALSSFNNNGWLLIAALVSTYSFSAFLFLYTTTLMVTLKALKMMTTKSMKLLIPFWPSLIVVSNMGGLPPMTMFWSKVMVIKFLLTSNMPTEICLLLVMTACYLLYHYLWMTLNETSWAPFKSQLSSKVQKFNKLNLMVGMSSTAGFLLMMTLGLT